MEPIKLSKRGFGDIASRGRGKSTITFKSNPVAGYLPLLKLFSIITGSNDYFRADQYTSVLSSVKHTMNLEQPYRRFSFRKSMRSYTNHNNPIGNMVISMMSVLGVQGRLNQFISQGKMGGRVARFTPNLQKTLVNNPVEVFILAMIKISDIGKINMNGKSMYMRSAQSGFIEIDPSLITLFVSEEKYHNKKYLDENYNKTVAKHLRTAVNKFTRDYEVKIEVVPDSVLKEYYTNPYSVETNSIFEIMEIDKQIKAKVAMNGYKEISQNLMLIE